MAAVLALVSSLIWGVSDFLGGFASRRVAPLRVLVVGTPAGAVLLLALAFLIPGHLSLATIAWGSAAGVAGAFGMGLLYKALAMGPMGVVSPVTAVVSAMVPITVGLADGERPGLLAWVGIVLAGVAIVLVSSEAPAREGHVPLTRRALLISLASGVAIGAFLALVARAPDDSGLWSVFFARTASGVLILAAAFVAWRARVRAGAPAADLPYWPPREIFLLAIVVGFLDATANAMYLLATRDGLLSVVAVLAALYPATTVLLARVVLHERMRWVQRIGMVGALVAAGLLAAGG